VHASVKKFHAFNGTVRLRNFQIITKYKGKGKSVPLQAWSGPEGSKKLRFPDHDNGTGWW